MSLRPHIEERWRALVDMLPDWLSRARHPAQFWPQFRALLREIELDCTPDEMVEIRQRTQSLVGQHLTQDQSEYSQAPVGLTGD